MTARINYSFLALPLLLLLCSSQVPPPVPKIASTTRERESNVYCSKGDPVPPLPRLNCSLCAGRCGQLKDFIQSIPCSCDHRCVAYGDCCVDFEQSCPIQFSESSVLRKKAKYINRECYSVTTVTASDVDHFEDEVGIDPASYKQINFIAVCQESGIKCNRTSTRDLLQPNLAVPVTDLDTGLHYVNYECARCNDIRIPVPWTPKLFCDPLFRNKTVSTPKDIKEYIKFCNVHYIIPDGAEPRFGCEDGLRESCPSDCNNSLLVEKCENSYITDHVAGSDYSTYKNFYCALCAGSIYAQITCDFLPPRLPGARAFEVFSLSLLFDFDPSEGVTVGRKACSAGQKWEPSSKECRQVSCPQDLRLVNGTCLSSSLQFGLTAALTFNETVDLEKFISQINQDELLIASMNIYLQPLVPDGWLSLTLNSSKLSDTMVNITLNCNISFYENSTFNFGPDLRNFTENTISVYNDQIILFLQKSGINLGVVVVVLDDRVSFQQALFNDCTWVSFSIEEIELENDTLLVKSSGKQYTQERYRLLSKNALVCVSDREIAMGEVRLDISPALGILTLILTSLSIVCLAVRIVLQFKISYFWSFAGKLQCNLALGLCLAFLMLLLGGVVSLYGVQELCAAFGILMYWFFLVAFSWMAVVTFDTWLVFRPSANFVKTSDTDKSLVRYTVPSWLIPAGIAIIVTSLDYVEMDGRFKPQFGRNLCWFNQRYALLVYFGIPVAVLSLFTTIFFIITVVHLRKTLKSSIKTSSTQTSHEISIYIRLFTLMGVSWIIGFIAAFVGHEALWIIFILLNASQGILIFISFVLNKKVLQEIRKTARQDSHTAKTGSTGLSEGSAASGKYSAVEKIKNTPTTSI